MVVQRMMELERRTAEDERSKLAARLAEAEAKLAAATQTAA